MPTITITLSELFNAAVEIARNKSEKILKLADINKVPLGVGETADTRRHQIASLGKQLAETFLGIDEIMQVAAEAQQVPNDITANPMSASTDQGGN